MGHPVTIQSYVRFLATLYGEFAALPERRMGHTRFHLRVGNYFGDDDRTIRKHTEKMLSYGLITNTGESYMMREAAREAVRQLTEDDPQAILRTKEVVCHA